MDIIGLKELRENVSIYAREVQHGRSFVVVKQSKPIFKISPIVDGDEWEEVVDFTKIKKGGVDIKAVLGRL